jgi:hypothetical protein
MRPSVHDDGVRAKKPAEHVDGFRLVTIEPYKERSMPEEPA